MRSQRGFTLVEVMVAATLLAMIMAATVAAMRAFGNTRATLEEVTYRVEEVRAVSDFLRDTVGGAMPVLRLATSREVREETTNFGTFFTGSASEFTWVAPVVAGADLGGAMIMHLSRVDDTLVLRWHPYFREVEAVDWSGVEGRVLLDEVETFQVGYLAQYGEEWLEAWPGAQNNPVAVRMSIRAHERYWPELVVRLDGASLNMR